MAEEALQAATSAAAEAARGAIDICFSGGAFGGFSFSLKIDNPWLAAGIAIGTFYLANRALTEIAIKNSLQQQTPSGNADPEVTAISTGSIRVQLTCYTEESFLLFTNDIESKKAKYRLGEELAKIGFSEEIRLTVENNEEFEMFRKKIRRQQSEGSHSQERLMVSSARSSSPPVVSGDSASSVYGGVSQEKTNELSHSPSTAITESEFENKWDKISSASEEILAYIQQNKIQRLKNDPIDHDTYRTDEGHIKKWRRLQQQENDEPSSCLPDEVPEVFGRSKVFNEVKQYLQSGTNAVLLITGRPGFGKTTVAGEICHKLMQNWLARES